SDVVIARELTAPHPHPVVHDGERRGGRIGCDRDSRGARVERVRHDLGEDGLLGGAGVGVAEILEQVQEVDARLAHRGQSIACRSLAGGLEGWLESDPLRSETHQARSRREPPKLLILLEIRIPVSDLPCSPPMARYAAQAILLGVTVAITTAAPAGAQTYRLTDHRAYSREIADAAARHAVPERLVWAVIRAESGFDPRAVSRQGARGLMQLMPETAAMLGVRDAFNPRENIDAGVRHLRALIERFRNDLRLAIAAYN